MHTASLLLEIFWLADISAALSVWSQFSWLKNINKGGRAISATFLWVWLLWIKWLKSYRMRVCSLPGSSPPLPSMWRGINQDNKQRSGGKYHVTAEFHTVLQSKNRALNDKNQCLQQTLKNMNWIALHCISLYWILKRAKVGHAEISTETRTCILSSQRFESTCTTCVFWHSKYHLTERKTLINL